MAHTSSSPLSAAVVFDTTDTSLAADAADSMNPWCSPPNLSSLPSGAGHNSTASQIASWDFRAETAAIPQSVPTNMKVPLEESTVGSSVLDDFDPLVSDPSEQSARDAWAATESHPPAVPGKDAGSPDGRSMPLSSPPQSVPATSSTFSLASFARTLTLSPRRSVTPPLPPPPRSSSLRHSYPASISSSPVNPASPTADPIVVVNDDTRQESSVNHSTITLSSEGVTITSSAKLDVQFDFQRFLDQMKTKGADPIAKYLRSFLSNFAKKMFTVNDQIKVIRDFLDFIADKMRTMDGSPWQNVSFQEFDNSMEAMEKLVMNRLYEFTFQPLLPASMRATDDTERDHVLRQRIGLFGWVQELHLDVPTGGESGQGTKEMKGFLEFSRRELLKINHYKAPRDKLICILNCCKVIFGLIRHARMTEGADSFIPILIFVVLKANPEHLISNIEYINRFRNPEKLQSEAGYYLSSLMGAVSFIETMDHTSLCNISQEEFEQNVEDAIQSLSVTRASSPAVPFTPEQSQQPHPQSAPATSISSRQISSHLMGEEAARPLSLPVPSSARARSVNDPNSPQLSIADDTRRFFQRTSDTISKPLALIGRIFSDALDGPESGTQQDPLQKRIGWRDLPGPFAPLSIGSWNPPHGSPAQLSHSGQALQLPQTPVGDGAYQPPIQTPYKPRTRPTYSNSPASSFTSSFTNSPAARSEAQGSPATNQALAPGQSQAHRQSPTLAQRSSQAGSPHPSRNPTPTLDFGALQDEIDRAHLAAQDAARETLMQIFPAVDREVAEMVLEVNDGDLGRSIEALLEMSGGQPATT